MPPSKRRPVNNRSVHAAEALTGQTTYPVQLSGPLEGKQVHVGRVALHECLTCGHLMPTPAGQAKVDRNVDMGIRLFLGQLHCSPTAPFSTLPHACRKLTKHGNSSITVQGHELGHLMTSHVQRIPHW